MTEYVHRVTIAVPETHIADANELAVVLGESAADALTFIAATYEDASRNRYAVASATAKSVFVEKANMPLAAPEFAPGADLTAASRAQALLEIGGMASPTTIAVALGARNESAGMQIAEMGLSPMPPNDSNDEDPS